MKYQKLKWNGDAQVIFKKLDMLEQNKKGKTMTSTNIDDTQLLPVSSEGLPCMKVSSTWTGSQPSRSLI